MKSYWSQSKSYRENYDRFVSELEEDTRPWITDQEPPKDGTQLYFMCQSDYKGDTQYDVGYWADYTKAWWYDGSAEADCPEGEFDTEFGNCEEILGWKYAK